MTEISKRLAATGFVGFATGLVMGMFVMVVILL